MEFFHRIRSERSMSPRQSTSEAALRFEKWLRHLGQSLSPKTRKQRRARDRRGSPG